MNMTDKNNTIREKIRFYSKDTVGPVMYRYAEWVIDEATKRGCKRLYFLARDGYLLYEISKLICERRQLAIECRYLYCSRQSLRMPSYHLIGDEAYRLLLLGGYYITPKTILKRASLSDEEIERICNELDIADIDTPFTEKTLEDFRAAIRQNDFYREAVMKKSKAAYETAIPYFRQEGLFDNDYVAIVDSGWTGSMQRSLRQLLESAGYKGKITGFYFGMYVEPMDEADGEYLNFYFDAHSGARRKVAFCNNLFEIMLSANHAMTVGYEKSGEKVTPVFTSPISDTQKLLVESQIAGALEYTNEALSDTESSFDYKKTRHRCYKILKRAMVYPSKDFASVYGAFTFCDDVTEDYHMPLASPESKRQLGNYMLFTRIFRKLFKIKKANASELFWPYGTIAFCPAILRPWYRLNVKGWELLKAILLK